MSKHNDLIVDAHNANVEEYRVAHVADARGGYWRVERNDGRGGWATVAIGTTEVEVREVLARLTWTEPGDAPIPADWPRGERSPLGDTIDEELDDLPELGADYDAWLDEQNEEMGARFDAGMFDREVA